MGRKIYLLIITLILIQPNCFADPISKAIKALQKGKHQQVESILDKSLLKFPHNPGAHYAYSLLYFDSTYSYQNLDSAHTYIEQALLETELPDSLEVLPLEKADLTIDDLKSHKVLVDRQAFDRAVNLNTVEDFQFFIDFYGNAPQVANAISRRDILAFDVASNENTFASYKSFLDTYPDAYQVPIARERYDLLVFEAKTEDGKLNEYYKFLKDHPETPYRDQAEWQIRRFEVPGQTRNPGTTRRSIIPGGPLAPQSTAAHPGHLYGHPKASPLEREHAGGGQASARPPRNAPVTLQFK